MAVALGSQLVDATAEQELRPEHPSLLVGPLSELGSTHAPGKAEVVPDQRARPGLAADRRALDRERAKALRGGVHRRGEACRSGADDDHVEVALLAEAGRDS